MKTKRIKAIFAALAVMAVATVAAAVRVSAPLPPLGRACNPHEVRPAAIPGGTSWEVCGIRYDEDARGFRDGWESWEPGPAIVALGDSFTGGFGIAAEDAWPAQLGELAGQRVVNAGRVGASAPDVATSAEWFVRPRCAAVVRARSVPARLAVPEEPTDCPRYREPFDVRPVALVWAAYQNDACPSWDSSCPTRQSILLRPLDFYDAARRVAAVAGRLDVPAYLIVIDAPELEDPVVTWAMERLASAAGLRVISRELPDVEWRNADDEHHMVAAGHRWFAERVAAALGERGR